MEFRVVCGNRQLGTHPLEIMNVRVSTFILFLYVQSKTMGASGEVESPIQRHEFSIRDRMILGSTMKAGLPDDGSPDHVSEVNMI